ncbi:hypothetical protein VOLCADRAFT_69712 [Volvox carteri f. nagariensis]|uniref:Ammonium transporter n=1 Tax=Volvox carteri f. nagariensis TaxID=3068 RepID=D8UJ08_VOLCA|nr:uncharacterized protein VOLCADRAFT_69712 [Volvox carteri f. nagariensis]EFJ40314.1 hypothetical protein VOLCADRAFT_69712 [Volvox carteri f. nagariensis]|eukprot:XP_002958648.1 hypothetical protein VOLCADRAFT_69712 [Volvox carteri f. nagariensis]
MGASSFSEPLGKCDLTTLQSLQNYGLQEADINQLCAPPKGCQGFQDCLNVYLLARTAAANTKASDVARSLDVAFMLYNGYMVFMMQLGFAVLCAGSIRTKNCMNILLKNVLDACVGAIGFYLFGYAFAFGLKPGSDGNAGFIGNWNFALSYTTQISPDGGSDFSSSGWHNFFFQWSFCAATTTILSGAVAERCNFIAYLLYSFFLSSFVYPVVVHWVWGANGWLSVYNTSDGGYPSILKVGAIDFAGSGVVHMTGGFASLMGAWIIGPRVGRFGADGTVNEMKGHSATLVVMGTFLLWFGWFGFNPGSNLIISTPLAAQTVSRVAVCTAMSAGAGGVGMLLYKYLVTRSWDTVAVCNGVLAGLVAVTGASAVIEPWAAIICGLIAAVLFCLFDYLTLYVLKIDDPVSAFPLHGGVGMFGVLFPGLLARPDYVQQVYGSRIWGVDAKDTKRYGILYGGHGQILLANFIELVTVIGWSCFMMGTFFYLLHKAGLLRVSVETELVGLDVSHRCRSQGGA